MKSPHAFEHERAAFETCGVTTNGRAGGEWRVVSQTDINDDDSPEYVLQRASARNWHWGLVDSEGHVLRIAGDVRRSLALSRLIVRAAVANPHPRNEPRQRASQR